MQLGDKITKNAHEFAKSFQEEKDKLLCRLTDNNTSFGCQISELKLSEKKKAALHRTIDKALTDVFYKILLGLDGYAVLGNSEQQAYRIATENGIVLSENGELAKAAYEVFHEDVNEERAKQILLKYGFNFNSIPHDEIRQLLENEIQDYVSGAYEYGGSAEYLRVLCGYLFCIGNLADIAIIEKTKYINFDIGCMIDGEWIDSMKCLSRADTGYDIRDRDELITEFIDYYKAYFDL